MLSIGPPPAGNPESMRVAAAGLTADAEDLRQTVDRHLREVSEITFDGPAARRFRERTEDRARTLRSVAADLIQVAQALQSGAGRLEAAQRDHALRADQLRREAAARGAR